MAVDRASGSPKRGRSLRAAVPLALMLALLGVGCARKAPGPAECRELAYRMYGVRSDGDLSIRSVRANVDELTTECLLTPYDRELVACAEQTGAIRSCLRAFALRHEGVDVSPLGPEPRRTRRRGPFP